jgi:hypothetical protein
VGTTEVRIRRLEAALARRHFQSMSDQELLAEFLTIMSDEQRAEWHALGATEADILSRTKAVLRDWGYL